MTVIGAGTIAGKMAETLSNAPQGCKCYAISSRSLEKAKQFAEKWGIEKAFGSYEEMLRDLDVDLVYTKVVEVYCYDELVARYEKPVDMVTGYEYEVYECRRCIEQGLLESPLMPHKETISIMQQMDELRKEWGVVYPMDK